MRSVGCLSPRPLRAEEADSRNKAADCPDGARALKEELWRPVSRQRRTHRLRSCDGSELKFPRHDVPPLAFTVCAFLALGLPAAATAQLAATCDASLWDHVYHPARLVKLHECMRVTGTIVLKRPEKNGDVHIQLKLDNQFLRLLNATNKSRQGGNLVLQPICVGPVTQADSALPEARDVAGVSRPRASPA